MLAQSIFTLVESRRSRLMQAELMRAAARLVRDEISGSMEAVHDTIARRMWWGDELDSEPQITHEDRKALAANADAETLRRSFGSLRRYSQLRRLRSRRLAVSAESALAREELIEAVAVFLDLATARRLLSEFTGYGTAPFRRPVHIDDEVLDAALRSVELDSADSLIRLIERREKAPNVASHNRSKGNTPAR
ncbi:hypothetical protein AYL44_09575 [Microbacterium oleivorans]|uniref:Uncharacterized protein n=1 Tax=Microbacterium oleivorans TaxID=273677 RepID=A0A177K8X5_9MICO|nr:hypothetical protein AYL44_09575 [Microbacterium oleivorans]